MAIDKPECSGAPAAGDEELVRRSLAAFGSGGKWGFFDRTGRVVVPSIYDGDMYGFAGGLARVKVGKKYGYIDRTGGMVIQPRYVSASPRFSEGLAVVCEKWGGPWSFINRTGKIVFTIEAESVSGVSAVSHRFSNGMVWFRLGHQAKTRYGFMDRTGKVVIPARFEHVGGDFSEGLATFASGLKW